MNVTEYAIAARERTVRDFDVINSEQIKEVTKDFQKVLTLVLYSLLRGADIGAEARFDAFAVSKTSFDVLVSAFHMVRQRAGLESLALLRVALESACTALHTHREPCAHQALRSGGYKSTSAISYGKRHVPLVGELYGALSSSSIHVNYLTFGPRWEATADGETTKSININYGVRPASTSTQDAMLLTLTSLVTMILLKVIEMILTEDAEGHGEWRRLVGTPDVYFHATDHLIELYHDRFKQISAQQVDGEGLGSAAAPPSPSS